MDHEILSECLETIISTQDTKTAREAIETMLKMHRMILQNEENVTFRKIKLSNPAFSKKVWSLYPARQFLLMCGWIVIHEQIVFNHDERLLEIIEILVDHRAIAPNVDEWDHETKHEGKSESQLREEFLRRKAIAEREKELKEFMENKKYHENLADSIKKQIASDKAKRKTIFTHPVVGNKLVKGAKIRTLNSSQTPNQGNPRM